MAKKLSTVKKTKNGLVLDILKVSDLDPNIIQGYIHLNDKGGKRLGRWKYDKKNNVGIYALDLKDNEKVGELDLDLKGIKVNDENDLFTFSASGAPARFFYWLYDVKPRDAFKGMCPYFWSYVLTFLFIWIILPIVLFVKIIKFSLPKFMGNIYEWSEKRKADKYLRWIDKWNKRYAELSPKDCHRLSNTRCYKKWGYYLLEESRCKINSLAHEVEMEERRKKWEEETKREIQLDKIKLKSKGYKENVKESIIFKIIGFTITAFVLYLIVMSIYSVSYVFVDAFNFFVHCLPEIGNALLEISKGILFFIIPALVLLYLIFIGIKQLYCWVSCNIKINISCPKWLYKVGNSFEVAWKYICKFFGILITTIIAIYENNCPRITWKD